MARLPSLTTDTIETLLTAYAETGSQSAAARKAGVPVSTARRYLSQTPKAASPVVAQQRAVIERAGASMWDTRAALDENFARLLRLVEQLESAPKMEPLVYVVVLREIREHVTTGMKLARLMLDVNEVRLFQEAVVEA
jgi:molybdenum-dependent DNA-binding transcriptional regulator ModE